MADGAPELIVHASIDAAGANAGADEATNAIGRVKDAGEKAGEGLNNSLDNRRAVTHALRGLMELREGGVMAIGGLASEAFVATEAFEGMLGPLAPILMTLTLIASIGIPMFARMKDGAKDNQKAEEDLGKASEDASEKRIKAIESVIEAYGRAVKAQQEYNDELQKEAEYAQKQFDETEQLLGARTKLAVAELEMQRQVALGNAKTKEDVDAINERYKTLIDGTRSRGDIDVLDKKIEASAKDIADKEGDRGRAQEDLDPLIAERQTHRDAAQRAQDAATALGVNPDANGSYQDIRKSLTAEFIDLGHRYSERPTVKLRDEMDDVAAKAGAANRADDLTQGLAKWEETLTPPINKLTDQITGLTSAIADARINNSILQVEQQSAITQSRTSTLADQQEAQKKTREDDAATRKAQREVQEQQLQNTLDLMDDNNPQRGGIALQLARIKAQQLDDDKNMAIDNGTIEAGSPQAQLYDVRGQGLIDKAQGDVNKTDAKDSLQALLAEQKNATGMAEAYVDAHRELVSSVKDQGGHIDHATTLIEELTGATDDLGRELRQRLVAAEAAIASMKNKH